MKRVLCGFAAIAVTAIMSLTVVHATSTFAYATVSVAHPAVEKVALQPRHQWFGQPSPAVLVD
jgi:hypothetical protein